MGAVAFPAKAFTNSSVGRLALSSSKAPKVLTFLDLSFLKKAATHWFSLETCFWASGALHPQISHLQELRAEAPSKRYFWCCL